MKERGAIYVPSNPRTLPVRENFVPFASWFPFVNGRISVNTLNTLHGYGQKETGGGENASVY